MSEKHCMLQRISRPLLPQARPSSHTLYFNDGIRRIDMIIVYEDDQGSPKKMHARENFERQLKHQGLQLETEDKSVR
jgi:hypothetical protein